MIANSKKTLALELRKYNYRTKVNILLGGNGYLFKKIT